MKFNCSYSKILKITDKKIKPNPKNPNSHSQDQIERLAKIIEYQGQRSPIVISNQSGFMTKGHGRLLAMKHLKWTQVAVDFQDYDDEEQEYADIVADNAIAEWSFLDLSAINTEMIAMGPDFDIDLFGIKDFVIEPADLGHSMEPSTEVKHELFSEEQIVAEAYEFYRTNGFPYPVLTIHEQMIELNKLANTPRDSLQNSTVGYKVADTYCGHRFHLSAINMRSPVESFENDKSLKKALAFQLKHTGKLGTGHFGFLNMVSGTQACANFRPAMAKYFYDYYANGGVVLDPSIGFSGRLVGFIASLSKKYIGFDPAKKQFESANQIKKALTKKDVELYNLPYEDSDLKKESVDLVFTSPPYFKKEIYSTEKSNSCNKYPEYENWVKFFLNPFFEKSFKYLKHEKYLILNIEDVKIGGKEYALTADCEKIAKRVGFFLEKKDQMQFANKLGAHEDGEEEQSETIFFFRKPSK